MLPHLGMRGVILRLDANIKSVGGCKDLHVDKGAPKGIGCVASWHCTP